MEGGELLRNPEGGPNYKILVLDFNKVNEDRGKTQPGRLMIAGMYGLSPSDARKELYHPVLSVLPALSYKEERDVLKRELGVDEEFNARDFFKGDLEQWGGIVLTGSPFTAAARRAVLANNPEISLSPYMTEWKKETFAFIRSAVEHKIPVLGVCFGAQLIAKALGGEVERMKAGNGHGSWEWGWARIWKTGKGLRDPLIRHLPNPFVAAENHHDVISRLPERAVLLCENEYGPQGFRIDRDGKPVAWGFQFHPERRRDEIDKYQLGEDDWERLSELGVSFDVVLQKSGRELTSWLKEKGVEFNLRRKLRQQKKLIEAGLDPDEIYRRGQYYDPQAMRMIFTSFLDLVRRRST